MKFLRALTQKPWLSPGLDASIDPVPLALRRSTIAATGVWIYVCVATVMFALICVAYILRLGDFGADPAEAAAAASALAWWTLARLCGIPPANDWTPMAEPLLLWFNTGLLVVSSFAWEAARRRLSGSADRLRAALFAGGIFAIAFLAGQLAVWRMLAAEGLYATASPAYAFFYLITAVHGLHLLGGLYFWGRATAMAIRGSEVQALSTSVRLCAVYWHYLLAVWIVMFVLLLIT